MTSRIKLFVVSTSTCIVFVLLFGAMKGRSASPEDTYRHLAVYTEVLSRIKSDYVEEPDMKSVTSILVAKPSDETREGKSSSPRGPYPHIVAASGREETLAWAVERPDGGLLYSDVGQVNGSPFVF